MKKHHLVFQPMLDSAKVGENVITACGKIEPKTDDLVFYNARICRKCNRNLEAYRRRH